MGSLKERSSLADLDSAPAGLKGTIVLYKHSTRCGICDGAIAEIQAFMRPHPAPIFYSE
jgi:hypothetical protein